MQPSLSLLLLPTVASWAWAPSSCWSFPMSSFWSLSGNVLQAVVVLFFTPCMFLYVWPFPISSSDKYLFIVEFAINPVLNPATYTLRNKGIKAAMTVQKDILFQNLLTTYVFRALKLNIRLHAGASQLRHHQFNISWTNASSAILSLLLLHLWSIRPLPSTLWEMKVHHTKNW